MLDENIIRMRIFLSLILLIVETDIGEIKVYVSGEEIGKLDQLNRGTAGYLVCASLCYGDKVKIETSGDKLKLCDVTIFPREDFSK